MYVKNRINNVIFSNCTFNIDVLYIILDSCNKIWQMFKKIK